MSWRSNRTALLALGITLVAILGLAVMPKVRGSMLRVTRAGTHRLDSTEAASHDAADHTVDRPLTPLIVAPTLQHHSDPHLPDLAVVAPSFAAPRFALVGTVATPSRVVPPRRTSRPPQGRAPPAL